MEVSWGYIFRQPGGDPAKDRFVIDRMGQKATLVGVPDLDTAVRVAVEMADSGVKSIELCGHFGVGGAAAVTQALNGRAAVGSVMFPSESVAAVVKAFHIPI